MDCQSLLFHLSLSKDRDDPPLVGECRVQCYVLLRCTRTYPNSRLQTYRSDTMTLCGLACTPYIPLRLYRYRSLYVLLLLLALRRRSLLYLSPLASPRLSSLRAAARPHCGVASSALRYAPARTACSCLFRDRPCVVAPGQLSYTSN